MLKSNLKLQLPLKEFVEKKSKDIAKHVEKRNMNREIGNLAISPF